MDFGGKSARRRRAPLSACGQVKRLLATVTFAPAPNNRKKIKKVLKKG